MLLFAGQTQELPAAPAEIDPAPPAGTKLVSIPSAGDMIYAATSEYRPHPLVVDLAIRKAPGIYQRIRHHAWEAYTSGRGYLISAGGVRAGPANSIIGQYNDSDLGAAMPTTLMFAVADSGVDRDRFIRFEGTRREYEGTGHSYDDNLCVWRGFACGTNLKVPVFLAPTQPVSDCVVTGPTGWRFLDTSCFNVSAPRTFVAIYSQLCPETADCDYGFLEAVDVDPREGFQRVHEYGGRRQSTRVHPGIARAVAVRRRHVGRFQGSTARIVDTGSDSTRQCATLTTSAGASRPSTAYRMRTSTTGRRPTATSSTVGALRRAPVSWKSATSS